MREGLIAIAGLAVLIDGENVSPDHLPAISKCVDAAGRGTVRRIYGNVSLLPGWDAASGYRLIHSGSGKNAADIVLALDAMEFVLREGVRTIVLISSDGDFSHLATRLREYGVTVIGVGERKAPEAFRQACSQFHVLPPLTLPDVPPAPAKPAPGGVANVPSMPAGVADIDRKIRAVIAANSKGGQGMPIAALGATMHLVHDIRPGSLPGKTWRAYLQSKPALYALDPRGPQAHVRFRPDGFGPSA